MAEAKRRRRHSAPVEIGPGDADRDILDQYFAEASRYPLLNAAAEKGDGFYAIGVDKDQDGIRPGRVLTSMMKDVETAVYQTIGEVVQGKWSPGTKVFGIKEGGIHLSPMKHTKDKVPVDVLAQIDDISKRIADGTIKVPFTEEDLQTFQPPKI